MILADSEILKEMQAGNIVIENFRPEQFNGASYNVRLADTLLTCNNFVFNVGEEFFFVIPTNRVQKGDIIIASGKPKCVVDVHGKEYIEVMNYEDSTLQKLVPERHMFMGSAYFYGKIVSMFGNLGGKKTAHNKLMKFWMMSEMMKILVSLRNYLFYFFKNELNCLVGLKKRMG